MTSCLIVSSLEKSLDVLSQLLKEIEIKSIVSCKSASEARRLLLNQEFDLVLINTPLSDEFGNDLTIDIVKSSPSGVILLVKKPILDELSHKLNPYGVMCIGKPLDRQVFSQAISLAISTHHRISDMLDENKRLQDEVETIKIINRAKAVLTKYLNLSEAQAHHYIEKKSMDQRVSKEKIAKEILKTYD